MALPVGGERGEKVREEDDGGERVRGVPLALGGERGVYFSDTDMVFEGVERVREDDEGGEMKEGVLRGVPLVLGGDCLSNLLWIGLRTFSEGTFLGERTFSGLRTLFGMRAFSVRGTFLGLRTFSEEGIC